MDKPLAGKKVLFVLDCLELGGAERQALLLAAYLREVQCMQVAVLGLSEGGGRVAEICDQAGIACHGVQCNLSGAGADTLKALFRVLKVVRNLKPDVILPYTWRPNTVCGLIWRLSGAKLCIWNQRDEGRGLGTGFRCRLAVGLSSYFVSNSLAGKEFLMRAYGLRNNQIRIIGNGVALAEPARSRSEWRRALGVGESCFLVCMVANLHGFKDHATLIIAWRKVLDSVHDDREIMLILPGRFAGTEDHLKELIVELDLENRVKFLGKVGDISGLLHCADLYVHSSHAEGVPNAILEAMAAGLPVIATDISGNREAVGREGVYGLVEAKNPSAMSEKIIEFMRDQTLRENTGRALKERAGKNFPLSAMTCSMIDLIEGLFAGKAPMESERKVCSDSTL